ncbi:MAG: hypothetical protein IPM81_07695 [Saprospirales bacterium]|nr:hypothetical protein [Saprospirales bacterium]
MKAISLYQLAPALALALLAAGCCRPFETPGSSTQEFAFRAGSTLVIVETQTWNIKKQLPQFREVVELTYNPSGTRLALSECARNDIVELETATYSEVAVPLESDRCPDKITYSPGGEDLAAGVLRRPFHVSGQHPLDTFVGDVKDLKYHPGGAIMAIATERNLQIWRVIPAYEKIHSFDNIRAQCLAYSIDGTRLYVGVETGCLVLDATRQYVPMTRFDMDPVTGITPDPRGYWLAVQQAKQVKIYRTPDLRLQHNLSFPQATKLVETVFSPDGATLAIGEQSQFIHFYRVAGWQKIHDYPFEGNLWCLAFRPDGVVRQPLVFVHGHSVPAGPVWFEASGNSSFADMLKLHPDIPVNAVFLQLPLHGNEYPENYTTGIAEHAQDMLALIEGGTDSRLGRHAGLINFPAYRANGRVAIVGYSQGGINSRYYVRRLMGSRAAYPITVSELILLATPNHGVGGVFSCGNDTQPDLALRQLCAGHTATVGSQNMGCNACGIFAPLLFRSNTGGEDSLLVQLNGHSFEQDCTPGFQLAAEAPFSKPGNPQGILYVNLYLPGNGDLVVGGATPSLDCMGRRQARMHAPDVHNRELNSLPGPSHEHFVHDPIVICTVLKVLHSHAMPPESNQVCSNIKRKKA